MVHSNVRPLIARNERLVITIFYSIFFIKNTSVYFDETLVIFLKE